MDKRLKIVALVGLCGGIAIILCGALAFVLTGNFVPDIGPGEGMYGIFAMLGMFIFGFLILFLLSSYVVFGMTGVVTILILSKHINKIADAIVFPLASGIMTCVSSVVIFFIFSVLTGAYSGAGSFDLSDLATTVLVSVILLFLPGMLIACISGVIAWAAARKLLPLIRNRVQPDVK
jgi:hypothetical protein